MFGHRAACSQVSEVHFYARTAEVRAGTNLCRRYVCFSPTSEGSATSSQSKHWSGNCRACRTCSTAPDWAESHFHFFNEQLCTIFSPIYGFILYTTPTFHTIQLHLSHLLSSLPLTHHPSALYTYYTTTHTYTLPPSTHTPLAHQAMADCTACSGPCCHVNINSDLYGGRWHVCRTSHRRPRIPNYKKRMLWTDLYSEANPIKYVRDSLYLYDWSIIVVTSGFLFDIWYKSCKCFALFSLPHMQVEQILVEYYVLMCYGRNSHIWMVSAFAYVLLTQFVSLFLVSSIRKMQVMGDNYKTIALITYITPVVTTGILIGAVTLNDFINADAAVFSGLLMVFTTLVLGFTFIPKVCWNSASITVVNYQLYEWAQHKWIEQ